MPQSSFTKNPIAALAGADSWAVVRVLSGLALLACPLLACQPPPAVATPKGAATGTAPSQRPARPTVTAVVRPEPPPAIAGARVEGGLGVAAPTTLLSASPAGDWVALCQARDDSDGDGKLRVQLSAHGDPEGDALRAYYIERGGSGIAIDAFVGTDPTGRFVSFVRDGKVILRDTHAQKETDLSTVGAEAENDQSSYRSHRAGSFHPQGERFLYLRRHGERTWVVLRALKDGSEVPVDPGAGVLWRAEFEPHGEFVRMEVTTADTNGDRKLGWGARPEGDGTHVCPLPTPRFTIPSTARDEATTRLYRLSDGAVLEPQGFVMTVGDRVLVRNSDGELWLEGKGERLNVAGKECAGRVLHATSTPLSLLIGCGTQFGQRRRLFLRTLERRVALNYEVAAFETDGVFPHARELVVLEPGNESILVDMRNGDVQKLRDGTTMLASLGSRLLVENDGKLSWVDVTGQETPLGMARPAFGKLMHDDHFVTVGNLFFDVGRDGSPVKLPREPWFLARSGSTLWQSKEAPGSRPDELPFGPLMWQPSDRR